jgi:hypothetical protein
MMAAEEMIAIEKAVLVAAIGLDFVAVVAQVVVVAEGAYFVPSVVLGCFQKVQSLVLLVAFANK